MFRIKKFLVLSFCFLLQSFATASTDASEKPDIAGILMKHVTDAKEWHPLPFLNPLHLQNITAGNYSVPFTQHILMMLFVVVILFVVFIPAFAQIRTYPGKMGNILEPVIFFVRDSMIYPSMGKELGDRWLPFFLTLFFFILTSNMIGLIPLFSTITGNLSITIALALLILFSTFIQGITRLGLIGFFKNMIPHGLPLPIAIFVFFLEFIGIFIRSGVLAIRLFANMIAGHMVIGSLLLLIFIIHPLSAIVSIPMAVFIDLMEVLVAIIQAVVFTMLSAIFIGMASNHH